MHARSYFVLVIANWWHFKIITLYILPPIYPLFIWNTSVGEISIHQPFI